MAQTFLTRRSGRSAHVARALAVACLAVGSARAGQTVCVPDVEPLDTSPFHLEKRHGGGGSGGGASDDPRADARAISDATDAHAFAAACEAVVSRRFAARARCANDAECGGEDAGMCDASGRCNCNAGRAGETCSIDVAALCEVDNFWTAVGGEGLKCAGAATRTSCSPASAQQACVGTQTCAVTDRTCICAPTDCWDPARGACVPNPLEVTARAWARNPSGERDDADLMRRTSDWGIAFSGGGTRAMVSTFGILRGLDDAGMLDSARYLSCNSGSSWAASIYSYASARFSDAQLLGEYVPPERLSNETLWSIDEAQGAAAARRPFGAILLTLANNQRVRLRDLWALGVSKAFFEPYGFGKLFSFFGYTAKAVGAVRAASAALASAPFDVYRPNRPYLLISATLLGPRAQTVGDGGVHWRDQASQSFVISPLYTAPVRALADLSLIHI